MFTAKSGNKFVFYNYAFFSIPLETDPQVVAQRVALRMEETPFNDQTVSQVSQIYFFNVFN